MDVKLRTERYRKLKPAEACAQAANDGKLKEWLQKMEPCAENGPDPRVGQEGSNPSFMPL